MPNMTDVNVRKRMASRQRKISSNTDTPGEKSLHSGGRMEGRKEGREGERKEGRKG